MATLAGRNLPAKARARGLNVIELPGWEGRGETDGGFNIRGVILHQDAMGLGFVNDDLSDNLNVPRNMAKSGNGSQLWIGRDTSGRMALVFIASGRKWHAGTGSGFRSIPANDGNTWTVGIETDHTTGTGWPADMMHYIDVTTILLCEEFDIDPDRWLAGHREYAPGRKPDPEAFDLDAWRARAKQGFSERDWFDMATQQDLENAVANVLGRGGRVGPGYYLVDSVGYIADVVKDLAARLDAMEAALPAAVWDHLVPSFVSNDEQRARNMQAWTNQRVEEIKEILTTPKN